MLSGAIENLTALYNFLVLVTESSPIGLWSMAAAVVMPTVLGPYLMKYIPRSPTYPLRRQLIIDATMIVAGVLVAWLPWQTVSGLLIGLIGGLGSSAFWRLMETVFGPLWLWVKRRLGVADWKDNTP